MKFQGYRLAFALASLLPLGTIHAASVTYTDQAAFLADLAAVSSIIAHEGFESDAAWGHVRSPDKAPSVSNLGMTWTSNNLSSQVTTSTGAARTGQWGGYSNPHGSYTNPDPGADCDIPGDCGDGLRGSPIEGVLYGVGGWFRTNTPFAKVGLYIPVYNGDVEGALLAQTIGTAAQFFGVIDPDGFSDFEFRELEGKTEEPFEGDLKFIFADDFYFAGSHITAVPLPAPLLLLAGALSLLGFSDVRRRYEVFV